MSFFSQQPAGGTGTDTGTCREIQTDFEVMVDDEEAGRQPFSKRPAGGGKSRESNILQLIWD